MRRDRLGQVRSDPLPASPRSVDARAAPNELEPIIAPSAEESAAMADTIIDRIEPTDTATVLHLYNSVFKPERDQVWIDRRLLGRRGVLIQVARIEQDAVGFYVGMELKPDTHMTWVCGVVPDMRRMGIATQLMSAAEDWARVEGYQFLRFECENRARAFLSLGIAAEYDIVGIRYHATYLTNMVVFEKAIGEEVV